MKLKRHARTRKSQMSESETESSSSESKHDTDSDCNGSDEETTRSVRTKQSHRHNNKYRKYATFNGDNKFSVWYNQFKEAATVLSTKEKLQDMKSLMRGTPTC